MSELLDQCEEVRIHGSLRPTAIDDPSIETQGDVDGQCMPLTTG
jgi:hypothetical protein